MIKIKTAKTRTSANTIPIMMILLCAIIKFPSGDFTNLSFRDNITSNDNSTSIIIPKEKIVNKRKESIKIRLVPQNNLVYHRQNLYL